MLSLQDAKGKITTFFQHFPTFREMNRKLLSISALLFATAITSLAQWDRDVFMMRGRQALFDGKYSQAIENFNVLSRLDSSDHRTFYFRGIAKYDLGDIRGAQRDFSTSVRLNPLFTEGYRVRALSYIRTGDYKQALGDLQRAISLRPGMNSLFFTRGLTFYFAKRHDEAIADFDYFLMREPQEASAYVYRADCKLALGDTLAAFSDYNKAIETDRFYPEGYVHRAALYSSTGENEKALEDINKAISLDPASTYYYFQRGLINAGLHRFKDAISDLGEVLESDPGNALTLYNRSLMYAQVQEFDKALQDMDRVINVNPRNVLAYFNRAGFFLEMGRWEDAIDDYDSAIELYPDFAKAYMNRSYAKSRLGRKKESKKDYETARQKVREYEEKNAAVAGTYADTTRTYSSFIAFDADFARKDFNNELLQHRDVDIRLKPLFRFQISGEELSQERNILAQGYDNPLINRFVRAVPLSIILTDKEATDSPRLEGSLDFLLSGDSSSGAGTASPVSPAHAAFLHGIYEVQNKQYSQALQWFNKAVSLSESSPGKDPYEALYKAFYLMNRSVLRSEMTDIIASIESSAGTLVLDESGTARTQASQNRTRVFDRSEAISDMEQAAAILPDIPHIWFNLGNLYCLSSQMVNALRNYDKAISLYPAMAEAYFNRGLVLVYLKDQEKGCIDLSKAGELGIEDAYSVIDRYCRKDKL